MFLPWQQNSGRILEGSNGDMPDRGVTTIRDLIYYQYAKIIARSAFSVPDGTAAKGDHYGFIKHTFRDLKSAKKSWSEITLIPSLLEKKCLKTIYNCHLCFGTLDSREMDRAHALTVLDIDFIVR
jgi:hypothetical protein